MISPKIEHIKIAPTPLDDSVTNKHNVWDALPAVIFRVFLKLSASSLDQVVI
jgi:hypothetical protein